MEICININTFNCRPHPNSIPDSLISKQIIVTTFFETITKNVHIFLRFVSI